MNIKSSYPSNSFGRAAVNIDVLSPDISRKLQTKSSVLILGTMSKPVPDDLTGPDASSQTLRMEEVKHLK